MPARNSIKYYLENGYYHIYNRGVEKRNIYQDAQDYGVFLSYLKTYLNPKDRTSLEARLSSKETPTKEKDKILKELRLNNFYGQIYLMAYCLMPNHFHILVKQEKKDGIDTFMNSLSTRYVIYFNRKYQRVGPLFQGVYKAVLVGNDEQLLHLSRYIHRNPLPTRPQAKAISSLLKKSPQPSSYPDYIGIRRTSWLHPEEILSFFPKTNPSPGYGEFVNQHADPVTPPISNVIFEET